MESPPDQPPPEPPALEYASVRPVANAPIHCTAPIVALLLAMFAAVALPCMCGHLGSEALFATLPACALAVYAWVSNANGNAVWRVLLIIVVVVVAIVFLKNLTDVLWFGHEALLR